MSFAPIVMFVYNRADHFDQTITALSTCPEARQSELFIFSDAAKDTSSEQKVSAVRTLAHGVENRDLFHQVHVVESETNKGLANSVISGVTEVIEKYGRVIVLEDDCVPSQLFLTYINRSLKEFESDKRIGAIAGYAPPIRFPDGYDKDIFTAYRSCSWGWATWKDRWSDVDWTLKSISDLFTDKSLLKKLNSNGTDRFIRLYRQIRAENNSWSVRFGYHLVRHNMLTVYPRYSYIENIGCDSTGVHSKTGDDVKTKIDLSKAIADPIVEYTDPDERIQKQMKKFYSGGMISDVKRAVATKAIILKERIKR